LDEPLAMLLRLTGWYCVAYQTLPIHRKWQSPGCVLQLDRLRRIVVRMPLGSADGNSVRGIYPYIGLGG